MAIVPVTAMPYAAARRDELPANSTTAMQAHMRSAVHDRDEDLSLGRRRGVHDGDARDEAELHRLLRQRERAGDQGLRRDDRRHGGDQHHRVDQRGGHEREERPVRRRLAGRGGESVPPPQLDSSSAPCPK